MHDTISESSDFGDLQRCRLLALIETIFQFDFIEDMVAAS